jgi:hypothetical protein
MGLLVEVFLRKMTDRFCRAFFDLGLNLRRRRSIIDNDSELIVMDEEATCRPLSVGVERDCLNGQIADVTADHHSNETQQATRNRVHLGAVLHTHQSKHVPSSRKGSKTPRK